MGRIKLYIISAFAVLLVAGAVHAEDKKATYIGHDQCKVCHNKKPEGAQWTVWKDMKHARAFESLKSEEAKKIAAERGLTKPPHEAPECVKCHVTAYDPETMKAPKKIKAADGVQCETCHGPNSNHVADGRDVMFKKKTVDEIDWMAHLEQIEEKKCLKCHNEESPTWNPEQFTREDGSKVGFDFEQAKKMVSHPNPTKKK
jgi:hypothetical protein